MNIFCVFAVFPKILKSSGCKNDTKVLTCVCVSQGLPLPTITWLHLENYTEYTVITTVSKHTINSTFSLSVNEESNPAVDCVSSNRNGEIKKTLVTTDTSAPQGECLRKKEKHSYKTTMYTMIDIFLILIFFSQRLMTLFQGPSGWRLSLPF